MSAEDAQELPKIPELEGEYELVRELGRGGTAVVYLARERELGRHVAIKLIRPAYVQDDDAVARLVREARTVGKLQHPNIVMILGARRLAGRELALILQYVPGITLKERIRRDGALPHADAEQILRELGGALAYAHGHRIVHRDIKPENVYLDEESGVARLADFGIARVWDSDAGLTLPGSALGTPAYMSPEQVDGRDLDGRSDLFSLGLVGYEMLTGEPPWAGEGLYNIIYKQKHEELPPLTERCPGLPERIRTAIEGALKKDPAERWRDANEFLAALGGSAASPADAVAGGLAGVGPGGDVQPTPQAPPAPGMEDQRTMLYRPDTFKAGAKLGGAAASGETSPDPASAAPAAHAIPSWARPPAWLRGRKKRRATGAYASRGRSGNVSWELPDDEFDDDPMGAAGAPANPIIRRVVSVPGLIIVGLILLALGSLEVFSDGGYMRPLMASVRPVVDEYVRPVLTQFRSWTDGAGADGAQEAGTPRPSLRGPNEVDAVDSDGASAAGEPSAPARLQILGGELVRTGQPGLTLPGAIIVRVIDQAGNGVPGVDVAFEVAAGDGLVEPAREVTGSEGIVMVWWTLGEQEGLQRLRAQVPGALDGALIAEVTAEAVGDVIAEADPEAPLDAEAPPMEEMLDEADPPVSPVPIALKQVRGSNQAAPPGATLPGPLEARVTGDDGRPIANVPVRFAIISGGGAVAPTIVETDERGVARASWTLGPHEGPQLARAFVEGSPSLEVQFSADIAASRLRIRPSVAAGGTHTCSLAPNGSLECWGSNENGQLGDGSRRRRMSGVAVAGGPFASVVTGVAHTCALSTTGRLVCWGLNGSGQLGDGTTTAHPSPVPTAGDRQFVSVSAGAYHTCALTAGGGAFCWGANDSGQLGDGSIERATMPVRVESPLGFTQIAAGWRHTCALNAQGAAYCWGANESGEAGVPSNRLPRTPAPVAGGHRFRSLAAGSEHTCGVTDRDRILCWGANDHGQLGDGMGQNRPSPTTVNDPNGFAAVVAGGMHSCGLTTSGEVRCWGGNLYGQLGDGSDTDRLTPVAVVSEVTFSQIHGFGSHTCARTSAGNTFCWGYNVEGQLGDGTRENRGVPTPVVRSR